MMWGYGWDSGLMWLFGSLMIIGIVLLVILVTRSFSSGGGPGSGGPSSGVTPGRSRARQILDERFASGDLTEEQYREQVRILGEDV